MKRWYTCPHCRKKLLAYESGASSEKLYYKCPNCKKVIEIKINKPKE